MAKLGVRINVSNGGLSQVYGWGFNSVADLEDALIGLSDSGAAELSGDTDDSADIDSIVITPLSDYTVKQPKRIRKGYIDYETDGSITVTCKGGEDTDNMYTETLTAKVVDKESSRVFKGHRGKVSTNWEFELRNVNGADFSIDYLGVLFIPLTRSRGIK